MAFWNRQFGAVEASYSTWKHCAPLKIHYGKTVSAVGTTKKANGGGQLELSMKSKVNMQAYMESLLDTLLRFCIHKHLKYY